MRGRYRTQDRNWMFRFFPWFFGIVFVIAVVGVLIQFAVIGWAGYHAVTDPEGTANFVGNIVGDVVRPVAEAIREE
jgi:hypothetical protein